MHTTVFLVVILIASSLIETVECATRFHLGPKHACWMCEATMNEIAKQLSDPKLKSSKQATKIVNKVCSTSGWVRPIAEGCEEMVTEYGGELVRLISKTGTEDLAKRFCYEELQPPVCPAKAEVLTSTVVRGNIEYDEQGMPKPAKDVKVEL